MADKPRKKEGSPGLNAEVRGFRMEHESEIPGTDGVCLPSGGRHGPGSSRLILRRRFSQFVPAVRLNAILTEFG